MRYITSTTLDDTHNIIYCTNSSPITIGLPNLSTAQDRIYNIVVSLTSSVLIDPYSTNTFEGNNTYTLISGKAYTIVGNNTDWKIVNNVKNIIASEIAFTPNGDITASNIQAAVNQVRDNSAIYLDNHATDYNNPHQVSSSQINYVDPVYLQTTVSGTLHTFSNILNNTQGTGILTDYNVIWNPSGLFPTLIGIRSGSGYINYPGIFKTITWPSSSIQFAGADPPYTTETIHYIYVDTNGVINTATSIPNKRETLLLGSIYWNGQYATNFVQSNKLALEAPTYIYDYLSKLGAFIYDNGCQVTVEPGAGNELKINAGSGKVLHGLKEYVMEEISSTDIGSLHFPVFKASGSWDVFYYDLRSGGNITTTKWNDVSQPHDVPLTGKTLTFTLGSATVTCPDDLTGILEVGDMIWLDSDTIQYMNNIEAITYDSSTTITLSLVYGGTGGSGAASYTKALPDIPAGQFVKHLILRSLDDIQYFVPGQTLYSSSTLATADGAPQLPNNLQSVAVLLAFLTVEQGASTLVGTIQDIRPLPFSYKIGGSAGGGSVGTSHASLTGLDADDHLQYLLTDGSRNLTGVQKYNSAPTFTNNLELIDKGYGDGLISTHENTYNHVDLAHTNDVHIKHGFENRTDSQLPTLMTSTSFDLTGSSFDIWGKGIKYTKTSQSIDIEDTPGFWYIKYDTTGSMVATQTAWSIYDDIPICMVFWNGTEGLIQDERHNSTRNLDWHAFVHSTSGAKYGDGLNGTFNNSGFSISSGSIWDEDIKHTIAEQTQCRVFYRSGSEWTWTDKQNKYFLDDAGTVQYDNTGSLTNMTSNYYTVYWMFATGNPDTPLYVIAGQREDATLLEAENNNLYENLILPANIVELKILYKIYVKNNVSPYVSFEDYRNVISLANKSNSVPHNTLLNRTANDVHPAASINTNTTNFNGLLSGSETNVQLALDKLSAVSIATLGIGNVTNDAQLKRAANDYTTFASKSVPVDDDVILLEDSADGFAKKKYTLGTYKKQTVTYTAARAANVNADTDLRYADGVATNLTPFIAPFNCVLRSISAANITTSNETWTAQVLVNDVAVATLAITTTYFAYRNDLAVAINAGDKIRLRFLVGNTGAVTNPSITINLVEV